MTFRTVDEVPVDVRRARVYEEGWQSWSPTRWYRADATSKRPALDWQHLMRFRAGTELPARGFQGSGLLAVDPGTGDPVRVYGAAHSPDRVPSIRAELAGENEGRYGQLVNQVYRLADTNWGVFSMQTLTRTPEFRQATL